MTDLLPVGGSERAWLRYGGVRPKRRLGQNFLINPRVRNRLIDRLAVTDKDAILEVGSGSGALTIPMAKTADRIWAVEKDSSLYKLLSERVAAETPDAALTILNEDILTIDPVPFAKEAGHRLILVGNLPYAVTSPIILWILKHHEIFNTAFIMVQKEYGERLRATPGQSPSSSLTVWTAYHAMVTLEMKVPPGAFWPQPEVDSQVLRFDFHINPPFPLKDPVLLERSLRVAFGQRRKQLGGCVASALGWSRKEANGFLTELSIEPSRRGETLTLEEHCLLAQHLKGTIDNPPLEGGL